MINIVIGSETGKTGGIIFAKTKTNLLTITDEGSGSMLTFPFDWLANLDHKNLRQIRKTLTSNIGFYHSKADAHFALLTVRQMFKQWPNVTAVNNFVGYAFRVEKGTRT